jgi:zeaxanthin epoxidase
MRRTSEHIRLGSGVESYKELPEGGVVAILDGGEEVRGDVLIGADGIWSNVRASMTNTPARGDQSGVTYSGYTVFAGELNYAGGDPECGYKVYIGPQQYFVITDIGRGRYQWYAFLARPANSEENEEKPEGSSKYLQNLFDGWSEEIHDILRVTQEHEIEQRDLYDRPPSVFKPWAKGNVALLGDAVHAMMPNLGQGGCQAIEDALVISEQLSALTHRSQVSGSLADYRNRRLTRSAAVQGLSRFASDIIIRGFDTPCKIGMVEGKGFVFENVNYAGIVTRLLQPILPIFFSVQFAFLYDGWENKSVNYKIAAAIAFGGILLLTAFALTAGTEVALLGVSAEAIIGAEAAEAFGAFLAEQSATIQELLNGFGGSGL